MKAVVQRVTRASVTGITRRYVVILVLKLASLMYIVCSWGTGGECYRKGCMYPLGHQQSRHLQRGRVDVGRLYAMLTMLHACNWPVYHMTAWIANFISCFFTRARKLLNLRVFEDPVTGKAWDKSVSDLGLEILCVSQVGIGLLSVRGTSLLPQIC